MLGADLLEEERRVAISRSDSSVAVRTIQVPAMVNPRGHFGEGSTSKLLVLSSLQSGIRVIGVMPDAGSKFLTAEGVLKYEDSICPRVTDLRQGNAVIAHGFKILSCLMITPVTSKKCIWSCVASGIRDGMIYYENENDHFDSLSSVVNHCSGAGMRVHVHPKHTRLERNRDIGFWILVKKLLQETGATIVVDGFHCAEMSEWKKMAQTGRFYVTLTARDLAKEAADRHGRKNLIELVGENHPWVMAGIDDTPYTTTVPFGFALYAHALDGLLENTEGVEIFANFTSGNAQHLFGLSQNSRRISLKRKAFTIPSLYEFGPLKLKSFWAKRKINWTLLPEKDVCD